MKEIKRYVIPALFVVDAENEEEAEKIASTLQAGATNVSIENNYPNAYLFFDEKLSNKCIPIEENHENPHSYVFD